MQPIYGRLSDIFGRKVVLLASLLVFWIGSLACALAQVCVLLVCRRIRSSSEYDPVDRLPSHTRDGRRRCLDSSDDHYLRCGLAQGEGEISGNHWSCGGIVEQLWTDHRWATY